MFKVSTIFWGICMPSSCSHGDLESGLGQYLRNLTANSGLKTQLKINKELCYIRDDEWLSKLTIGTKLTM
jgi:hypothetical protein